jgi:hypothetical protein
MTDLPFIPILGPFGGNQLITAFKAPHPEAGLTIGYCAEFVILQRFGLED